MSKIFTIAIREYWAMVATKAFLISIVMMPILMFGGIFAMKWLSSVGGVKERKILVYDGTGELFEPLNSTADVINALMEDANSEEAKKETKGGFGEREKYILEEVKVEEMTDAKRASISDQIRDGDYYAFVEIPKDVIKQPDLKDTLNAINEGRIPGQQITFRSQSSALSTARAWMQHSLTDIVTRKRLDAKGIDPEVVKHASQKIIVLGKGLLELDADGNPIKKKEKGELATIFMPFGVMMLMFMVIFLAAQPALESVLEEKSQKIAEVLLGSANPFQLMIGKLMGVVGGSLTVFSVYIVGIIYFASSQNYDIPYFILPWFIVFQVLGVFFFAAMFMAVGASVNQLKEAQSMLLPIWMLMMSPMMVWFVIIRDPNGAIATGMSLFPPATPTALMLRMATGQTVPLWQPIVGFVLMVVSTLIVVHIASRIFRVGILWQGKTPSLKEMFSWAFSNK